MIHFATSVRCSETSIDICNDNTSRYIEKFRLLLAYMTSAEEAMKEYDEEKYLGIVIEAKYW